MGLLKIFAYESGNKALQTRKFNLHYVIPHSILRHIHNVDYELEFTIDLASVHLVLHVFLLKKCIGDLGSVVPLESVDIQVVSLVKRYQLRLWTIMFAS